MTKSEARVHAKKILTSHQSEEYAPKLAEFFVPFLQKKTKVISYRFHPPELNLDFLEKEYPNIIFFFQESYQKKKGF